MSKALQNYDKLGQGQSTRQIVQNGIIQFSDITKTALKERTEELKLNNSVDIQNMQACQTLLNNALAIRNDANASQEDKEQANEEIRFAFNKMDEIRKKPNAKAEKVPSKVLYTACASFTLIVCVLGSVYIASVFKYK